MNKDWTLYTEDDTIHTLATTIPNRKCKFRALLISDAHFDSVSCDRGLLKSHLDQAQKINAPVFHFGDWFDMMQGKDDPRGSKNKVRDRFKAADYFTQVVEESAEFLSQYDNLALWGYGNHETSVMRRHEIDPLMMLKASMAGKGSDLNIGGYQGFVTVRANLRAKVYLTKAIHYFHGAAGGGHVSGGMPENSKTRSAFEADLYYAGHQHNRSMDDRIITKLNSRGRAIVRSQKISLRGSTYKQEAGKLGWFVEKGMVARPQGGWWVDFSVTSGTPGTKEEILSMSPVMA